jgi:hypothetical protein
MNSVQEGERGDTNEIVTLHFAWSPPGGRVKANYRAEVRRYEAEGDRYVCRLIDLVEVDRSGATDAITDPMLRGLTGKYARVPREALMTQMLLPLKVATLTGGLRRPYFFNLE